MNGDDGGDDDNDDDDDDNNDCHQGSASLVIHRPHRPPA